MNNSKSIVNSDLLNDQFSGSQHLALKESVSQAIAEYFKQLDGHDTANLYPLLLSEIEPPLLTATLEYTNGNQCQAAKILGINRGTLRKKLKFYGLIETTS